MRLEDLKKKLHEDFNKVPEEILYYEIKSRKLSGNSTRILSLKRVISMAKNRVPINVFTYIYFWDLKYATGYSNLVVLGDKHLLTRRRDGTKTISWIESSFLIDMIKKMFPETKEFLPT